MDDGHGQPKPMNTIFSTPTFLFDLDDDLFLQLKERFSASRNDITRLQSRILALEEENAQLRGEATGFSELKHANVELRRENEELKRLLGEREEDLQDTEAFLSALTGKKRQPSRNTFVVPARAQTILTSSYKRARSPSRELEPSQPTPKKSRIVSPKKTGNLFESLKGYGRVDTEEPEPVPTAPSTNQATQKTKRALLSDQEDSSPPSKRIRNDGDRDVRMHEGSRTNALGPADQSTPTAAPPVSSTSTSIKAAPSPTSVNLSQDARPETEVESTSPTTTKVSSTVPSHLPASSSAAAAAEAEHAIKATSTPSPRVLAPSLPPPRTEEGSSKSDSPSSPTSTAIENSQAKAKEKEMQASSSSLPVENATSSAKSPAPTSTLGSPSRPPTAAAPSDAAVTAAPNDGGLLPAVPSSNEQEKEGDMQFPPSTVALIKDLASTVQGLLRSDLCQPQDSDGQRRATVVPQVSFPLQVAGLPTPGTPAERMRMSHVQPSTPTVPSSSVTTSQPSQEAMTFISWVNPASGTPFSSSPQKLAGPQEIARGAATPAVTASSQAPASASAIAPVVPAPAAGQVTNSPSKSKTPVVKPDIFPAPTPAASGRLSASPTSTAKPVSPSTPLSAQHVATTGSASGTAVSSSPKKLTGPQEAAQGGAATAAVGASPQAPASASAPAVPAPAAGQLARSPSAAKPTAAKPAVIPAPASAAPGKPSASSTSTAQPAAIPTPGPGPSPSTPLSAPHVAPTGSFVEKALQVVSPTRASNVCLDGALTAGAVASTGQPQGSPSKLAKQAPGVNPAPSPRAGQSASTTAPSRQGMSLAQAPVQSLAGAPAAAAATPNVASSASQSGTSSSAAAVPASKQGGSGTDSALSSTASVSVTGARPKGAPQHTKGPAQAPASVPAPASSTAVPSAGQRSASSAVPAVSTATQSGNSNSIPDSVSSGAPVISVKVASAPSTQQRQASTQAMPRTPVVGHVPLPTRQGTSGESARKRASGTAPHAGPAVASSSAASVSGKGPYTTGPLQLQSAAQAPAANSAAGSSAALPTGQRSRRTSTSGASQAKQAVAPTPAPCPAQSPTLRASSVAPPGAFVSGTLRLSPNVQRKASSRSSRVRVKVEQEDISLSSALQMPPPSSNHRLRDTDARPSNASSTSHASTSSSVAQTILQSISQTQSAKSNKTMSTGGQLNSSSASASGSRPASTPTSVPAARSGDNGRSQNAASATAAVGASSAPVSPPVSSSGGSNAQARRDERTARPVVIKQEPTSPSLSRSSGALPSMAPPPNPTMAKESAAPSHPSTSPVRSPVQQVSGAKVVPLSASAAAPATPSSSGHSQAQPQSAAPSPQVQQAKASNVSNQSTAAAPPEVPDSTRAGCTSSAAPSDPAAGTGLNVTPLGQPTATAAPAPVASSNPAPAATPSTGGLQAPVRSQETQDLQDKTGAPAEKVQSKGPADKSSTCHAAPSASGFDQTKQPAQPAAPASSTAPSSAPVPEPPRADVTGVIPQTYWQSAFAALVSDLVYGCASPQQLQLNTSAPVTNPQQEQTNAPTQQPEGKGMTATASMTSVSPPAASLSNHRTQTTSSPQLAVAQPAQMEGQSVASTQVASSSSGPEATTSTLSTQQSNVAVPHPPQTPGSAPRRTPSSNAQGTSLISNQSTQSQSSTNGPSVIQIPAYNPSGAPSHVQTFVGRSQSTRPSTSPFKRVATTVQPPVHASPTAAPSTASLDDMKRTHLRSMVPLQISPLPHDFQVPRTFLRLAYGGSDQQWVQFITADKNPSGASARRLVFPKVDLNPAMPTSPGEPGLIFSSRHEILSDPPWSVFHRVSPASAYKRKGPVVWKYLGDYECVLSGRMTGEQFVALADEVKRQWAQALLDTKRFEVYVAMRARIALRLAGLLAPKGAHDGTNDEDQLVKDEIKAIQRGNGRSVREEEIIAAFSRGDEAIDIIRLNCVQYDHVFADHMRDKLASYPSMLAEHGQRKANGEFKTKNSRSKGKKNVAPAAGGQSARKRNTQSCEEDKEADGDGLEHHGGPHDDFVMPGANLSPHDGDMRGPYITIPPRPRRSTRTDLPMLDIDSDSFDELEQW